MYCIYNKGFGVKVSSGEITKSTVYVVKMTELINLK